MTTLYIKSNPDLSLELGEKYFAFKWKEKLKTEVFIRASIFAFLLCCLLFALTEHIFFLSAILCSLLFVIYSAATFFSAKRKYFKLLRKSKIQEYEMTYSEKGIIYKLPNAESNFDWTFFKYYETNGNVIYLYNNSGNALIDIFSARKFGEKPFLEIKDLILGNVQKK